MLTFFKSVGLSSVALAIAGCSGGCASQEPDINHYTIVLPPEAIQRADNGPRTGGGGRPQGAQPLRGSPGSTYGDSECWIRNVPNEPSTRECYAVDGGEYIGNRPRSPGS